MVPIVVTVALAVVVAIVLVVAAFVLPPLLNEGDDERAGRDSSGEASDGGSDGLSSADAEDSNLDEVAVHEDLDPTHVAAGTDVDYPQSPPVGGNHYPVWVECGVYDDPLTDEYAVHDLEHGAIWITYRPDDVDDDNIEDLEGQLPDNGIMSPYPDQSAPVVITTWGRQLELTGPDDPRIGLFIDEYGAGETAPEPFASCHGGQAPVSA